MRARLVEYVCWLLVAYMNAVWAIGDIREGADHWAALWLLGFFIAFANADQQAKAIRKGRTT